MKRRSTLQQLLIFLDDIYENTKAQTDVIYLDFAKAFDQVPNNEMLLKLWQFDILAVVQFLSYQQMPMCVPQCIFFDNAKCYNPILQLLDSLQLQQDLDTTNNTH